MYKNKITELFNLNNKHIIVTGAGGTLGKKHVEAIAAANGIPVMLDINLKELKNTYDNIFTKYKIKPIFYKVDITNEKQIKNCCKKLIKKIDCLYGLINNAANNPYFFNIKKNNPTRLENYSLDNWNKDLSVSLTGSFLCAKYFGNEIAKNKNGGVILNISSDLGLIAPDQRLYLIKNKKSDEQSVKPVSYSVTKFGIIGLTKYLSTYWPKKVRCNVLCPGGVEEKKLDKDFIKNVISRIPMGRMAKQTEYQATIIYLLSEASSYLNGSVVTADGGRTSW